MNVQHAGFEAAHAECKLREDQTGDGECYPRPRSRNRRMLKVVTARRNLTQPVRQQRGMAEEIPEAGRDDDARERDVRHDENSRQADHLAVALEEHTAQQHEQEHGHGHLTLHPARRVPRVERVGDKVGSGIGGGQRLRDDEVGRCEPHENEYGELRRPTAEHPLDHAHRTDAVGSFASDVAINGQRAQKRDEHENQRGNRGECSRPLECDRGLVAEGAEVIHSAEAHDEPPCVVVIGMRGLGILLSGHGDSPRLGPQGAHLPPP